MRRARRALVTFLWAVAVPAAAFAQELQRFEFAQPHMGTIFRVVVYAPGEARAAAAADEAFALAARLDSLLSDYRDDSEIAELARRAGDGRPYRVDEATFDVLVKAKGVAGWTEGAFDPTVGPLTRLWRWSARRGELPDSARLAEARALVGWRDIGTRRGGVTLAKAGMSLDLGGIAKGYAADEMVALIGGGGLPRVMVDAGGDVVAGDPPPGEAGWRIETPGGEVVTLAQAAVATSGDAYRWVEIDGVRYSHILDPRTGLGVVDVEPVTIVAPFGFAADALSSALSVVGREEGDRILAKLGPGVRRVEARGVNR